MSEILSVMYNNQAGAIVIPWPMRDYGMKFSNPRLRVTILLANMFELV